MHDSHIDGQLPALITVALTVVKSSLVSHFLLEHCPERLVGYISKGGETFWRGKRAWQALTAGPSGASGADIQYGIDQRAMPCCT